MKQIFCITAYKDFDYLNNLTDKISKLGGIAFIHIDKKSLNEEILQILNTMDNVYAISKYKIPWGGIEHVLAIIELINMAVHKIDENFYLHVITGQDCICKSIEELNGFFCEENMANYMSISNASNNKFRYRKYYRNDLLNYKSRIGNLLTKILYVLQKILLINRKPFLDYEMYKGLVYVSITKEFCNYIVDFLKKDDGKKYLEYLKWCFIPEEFFFQTIAMNSKFQSSVVSNNYRYILWQNKHGTQPGILDENDYEDIRKSDCFFARKLNIQYSKKLMDMLDKDIY